MSTTEAKDTTNESKTMEETENKGNNDKEAIENNPTDEKKENNETNENTENVNNGIEKEKEKVPILKKIISSATVTKTKSVTDIKKKLRNILDGVSVQETDLKKKKSKLEEWYNLHRDALSTAQNTKKMLTEFDVINENDNNEIRATKTKNKTDINLNLDLLEKQLKKINLNENKYRSRESIKENNELTAQVKKLQDKYKILSKKYNQQSLNFDKLNKNNTENENKIKLLIETNKKTIEEIKKSIENKHKNYIQNLQSQHENILKKQKDDNDNKYNQQIEQLKLEKNNEINKLSDDCKRRNEELEEYKLRETAHKELMLKWQAQKDKKNKTINELSLNIQILNKKMEDLEGINQKLQETTALNSIQMTQKDEAVNECENKCNILNEKCKMLEKDKKLLEAKLKVSIKEIIKLRQQTKSKDENKTKILTEMSNLEIDKNKKINILENNINKYKNEILLINKEFIKQFELLNLNLNDVHSKLESFSVTIRNFSGNSLKQSYSTELEARKKSNAELPAWQDNIREQVRKTTEQIAVSSVSNEQQNIKLIKESETQIAHIKLTGLQLLDEYTSLLMGYNHLYISHHIKNNNNNNNNNKDNANNNKNIFKSRRKSSNQKKTSNQ